MRLYRRKEYGVFYVELSRNRRRSLKTTDPREAKRLYHAIRREYLAGRLLDISGGCPQTLGEFYDELEDLGPVDKAQGSFENDLAALRKLINIVGRTIKLDRISPKHIHTLAAAMKRAGRKVGTVNNVIRHARSTFNGR
ncbi:MAG: hypothetical protein JRJ59_06285 [Deltaproteobacteria bacterium]|nr:hypothetical protein [Deltaproteobacteria bacterium]